MNEQPHWVCRKSSREFITYGLLSVVGYALVLGLLSFFVEVLNFQVNLSYAITYLFSYIFEYTTSNKLIFKTKHNRHILIKYLLYILTIYVMTNCIFFFYVNICEIQYQIATFLAIGTLFPIKFLFQKYLVFTNPKSAITKNMDPE